MKSIESVVRAKLDAQFGQGGATALWEKLWTAYEEGGVDGARSFVEGLLEVSDPAGSGAGDEEADQ